MKRYPTMRTRTLKFRHTQNVYVDATIDVMTGRPIVVVDSFDDLTEDISYTPAEAERLAKALLEGARIARAKITWVKANHPGYHLRDRTKAQEDRHG